MGWLGVTLKQVLTRVRAGRWRCHSDVITVRDDTGRQGAGDVTQRKHAEVCVRIWRKYESGPRRQTKRIDFWSSQAQGKLAPYGGALELGAKWIRQHRRLCLSSLRRNLQLKVNKKVSYLNKKSLRVFEFRDSYVLYIFHSNEHYMSISYTPLIANMVHMIIWCQNLGICFMIWFTTGLPWFNGDDQKSG